MCDDNMYIYIYKLYTHTYVLISVITHHINTWAHMYINLFYMGYTSIHITSNDTNLVCCSHLPSENVLRDLILDPC